MSRDVQRKAVYRAEDQVAAILDRGGTVEHHGSLLTVPAERRFGDVGSIQPYLDAVLTYAPVAAMPGADVAVRVRERAGARSAHYERSTATMAIPPYHRSGWALRETVVLHELAHHLDPEPTPPHGPSFAATLVTLYEHVIGPEAAHLLRVAFAEQEVAVGTPQARPAEPAPVGAKVLDRISKVLAMAERTDNPHEAEAFMAQAQQMATRYSIDLAVARRHVARTERRETPEHRTVRIGEVRKMGNTRLVQLFTTIAQVNDCRCDVAANSTSVYPFGFPADLDVVEALYAHLSVQMVQGANAYLATGEHRRTEVWSDRAGAWVPASGRSARLSFYDAFVARIGSRLAEARDAAVAEAAVAPSPGRGEVSTALVLADKRAEVEDFYRSASTARGSWSGWRGRSEPVPSAHRAGDRAAREARLTATPTLPGGRAELE